uniref:Uncharacterized protein n=1 Tax=Arundo donax TaxID=35708 RepID=A0A0A9A628_ARUDO
MAGSRCPVTLR